MLSGRRVIGRTERREGIECGQEWIGLQLSQQLLKRRRFVKPMKEITGLEVIDLQKLIQSREVGEKLVLRLDSFVSSLHSNSLTRGRPSYPARAAARWCGLVYFGASC